MRAGVEPSGFRDEVDVKVVVDKATSNRPWDVLDVEVEKKEQQPAKSVLERPVTDEMRRRRLARMAEEDDERQSFEEKEEAARKLELSLDRYDEVVAESDRLRAISDMDTYTVALTREEMFDAQREDFTCLIILKALVGEMGDMWELTKHNRSLVGAGAYRVTTDGMLVTKAGNVVVPKALRFKVIAHYHSGVLASHQGISRTTALLKQRYFWPKMGVDIKAFVKGCVACQVTKSDGRQSRVGLTGHVTSNRPLEVVHIDVVGPLPETQDGNKYIVTMIDNFSGLVMGVPSRTATSKACAIAFVNHWVARYGCPRKLLSDRGSEFISELFEMLASVFGIKQLFTSGYHAQTNGKLERFHRYLKACLVAKSVGRDWDLNDKDQRSPWDAMFPLIMASYNATKTPVTGYSPFEIVYGQPFMMPGDNSMQLEFNRLGLFEEISSKTSTRTETRERYAQFLKLLRNVLTVTQRNVKKIHKEYVDKWTSKRDERRVPHTFFVGQKVFLMVEGLTGNQKKLSPRFKGTFVIKEVRSAQTVVLANTRTGDRVVNVSKIKPCIERVG